MNPDKYPFAQHVKNVTRQLSALEKLELPQPLKWTIDWKIVKNIAEQGNGKAIFSSYPFFKGLSQQDSFPAIYHFSIERSTCPALYGAFRIAKDESSEYRRNKNIKDPGFRNICHVPKYLGTTKCLYVGSVKKNVASRIQQHLGLINTGRTGAMYLRHILPLLTAPPTTKITVYFFDKPYVHLTEHMEYVFQTSLRPLLGKRSLNEVELDHNE